MGDFAIQPFTRFLKLGTRNATPISSSRMIVRKDDDADDRQNFKKERVRREKMSELFSELQLLVPSHDRIEKKTREMIVEEAIGYLKYLEEEKKSLEDLKRRKEMGARSKAVRVLSECSSMDCGASVNVCVSNGVAFFGIELPGNRGLLTQVFRVFERNQAEVLAANVATNDQQCLSLTATVLLLKIGSDSVEKIKREIQSLVATF